MTVERAFCASPPPKSRRIITSRDSGGIHDSGWPSDPVGAPQSDKGSRGSESQPKSPTYLFKR